MDTQPENGETTGQTDRTNEQTSKTTNNEGADTMKTINSNPVLDFAKNLGETLVYLWHASFDWVVSVSWKKFLLVSLLGLIIGGIIELSGLAKFLVFGALIIKFFGGKEHQHVAEVTEN